MAKNKRYDEVSQMVRDLSESQDFSEAFEKRLADRQIMKQLALFRTSQALSQEDIAQKLGCTQSKISKLEASNDGDLQMDDLVKYAEALGLRLQFLFFKKGMPAITMLCTRCQRLGGPTCDECRSLYGV